MPHNQYNTHNAKNNREILYEDKVNFVLAYIRRRWTFIITYYFRYSAASE